MSTPSPEKDLSYAADMLEAASRAVRLAAGKTQADLDVDELFQLAMLHLIQVVGEAAFKVSPDLRRQHPEISLVQDCGNSTSDRSRLFEL